MSRRSFLRFPLATGAILAVGVPAVAGAAAHHVVSLRESTDTAGQQHTLANLERPQLLFDDAGQPICLYAAAGEQDPFKGTPSCNLQFAVRPEKR